MEKHRILSGDFFIQSCTQAWDSCAYQGHCVKHHSLHCLIFQVINSGTNSYLARKINSVPDPPLVYCFTSLTCLSSVSVWLSHSSSMPLQQLSPASLLSSRGHTVRTVILWCCLFPSHYVTHYSVGRCLGASILLSHLYNVTYLSLWTIATD